MVIREKLVNLSYIPESRVAENIRQEIGYLANIGYDVSEVVANDQHALTDSRQKLVDNAVEYLEQSENGHQIFRSYPGISAWEPLTKRAIALHTLYNPTGSSIGEGIEYEDYFYPLFQGKSAAEVLSETKSPAKAEKILSDYSRFILGIMDEGNLSEIGSRDLFQGVVDAKAVRTRANSAMEIVANHINEMENGGSDPQALISASLACGAAGPVYNLVSGLERKGYNFSNIILVDSDPMALSTAYSLSKHNNLHNKVELQLKNLLLDSLTDFIEPESVDIVDLLGLFEYLPDEYGVDLLKKVQSIVKPGGLIVFGNMLNERPQQKFFDNIVSWPHLEQRSIEEVVRIIDTAGFDTKNDTQIRIPSEGVYAVYGIVKSRSNKNPVLSVAEELGLSLVEEY